VGGFATPPDGFFGAIKAVLDREGILFISDEVQTGWGRTGENFWGYQAHGITPDILTFAKGIGNGLAIAGVVARAEIMDCLAANSISTFGGNPLATAGALANLDYVLRHDLQANAYKMGGQLREGLDSLAAEVPEIIEVRGKGLMLGVELAHRDGSPDPALTARIMEEAKAGRLLIGKGGLYGNTLRIAPPLTVTAEEVAEGLGILEDAVKRSTGG
jgi:4-aminobutyrate aminotransferase